MLYYMRIKRDLFLLASAWLSLDLASSARFMAYFLVNMLNNMTAPNPEHRISRPAAAQCRASVYDAGPTLCQRCGFDAQVKLLLRLLPADILPDQLQGISG